MIVSFCNANIKKGGKIATKSKTVTNGFSIAEQNKFLFGIR